MCDQIVELLEANKFRSTIDNELEVLDHTLLKTREEKFCAVNLLTHLGAAYVNDQNYGVPSGKGDKDNLETLIFSAYWPLKRTITATDCRTLVSNM